MKCPFCGHENTRVIDSRPAEENNSIRRRRVCDECDKRFTTYEKVETISSIGRRYAVLYESLSATAGGLDLDTIADLASGDESLRPDIVLYVGDTLVSNKIKRYVASLPDTRTIGVNIDGEVHDTFMNQSVVIGCDLV